MQKFNLFVAMTVIISSGCGTAEMAQQPDTQPSGRLAKGAVAARVNGEPISMGELTEAMIESHGLQTAQMLIVKELIRQKMRKSDIKITDENVRAENRRTLEQMFPEVKDENQRKTLLKQFLQQREFSERQWEMTMRRNAALRKLADRQVKVSEEEIRKEFERQGGKKVVVRHIQCASLSDAQEILDKIEEGADFAELAKEHSKNPSAEDGGLLPPIGKDSPNIPPAISEAAMGLQKVGEVSNPVQTGTAFHVLKLEKIIPPDKTDFEKVKDDLRKQIRSRKVQAAQRKILQDLVSSADIEYVNPQLKAQAQEAESQ